MRFYKYQGTGNDFILVDDRKEEFNADVEKLCDRRFGIGADGLMLLRNCKGYDFEMVYYNSDGKPSSMCGNGGRCIVAFAKKLGVVSNKAHFMAVDGEHHAEVNEDDTVSLSMLRVNELNSRDKAFVLDTGSPHYVIPHRDLEALNLVEEARKIRYNEEFRKEGINVNFIEPLADQVRIRTYERGVEDETLSCGTGVTAAAIVSHTLEGQQAGTFERKIRTEGGLLEVSFTFSVNEGYTNVCLTGPAVCVFEGDILSS